MKKIVLLLSLAILHLWWVCRDRVFNGGGRTPSGSDGPRQHRPQCEGPWRCHDDPR